MLKSQSKVKELSRELRNKTEESDEYKRKMETLKNERRRGEKTITEVITGHLSMQADLRLRCSYKLNS